MLTWFVFLKQQSSGATVAIGYVAIHAVLYRKHSLKDEGDLPDLGCLHNSKQTAQ
jgi:hypothetical protein